METTVSPGDALIRPARAGRKRGLRVWGRRALLALLVVPLLLAATGALYQAVATARDARAYPAPGRLVDVGGYRLHLQCVGEGSPTVVLEAVSGGLSLDWAWVQPEVARATRVCAYDRAGRGWSDPGPAPRDARQLAGELHTLLGNAGVAGPYVLVGHSAGGVFVREYAARYPGEVAGMVLLDAAHPDLATRDPGYQAQLVSDRRMTATIGFLARFGGARLLGRLREPAPDLPARQRAEYRALYAAPGYWDSIHAELVARPQADAQVRATGGLGDRPLLVISAGTGSSPLWQELQDELATLSTNSGHRVIEGARHLSLTYQQEYARATGAAIVQVVEAARTGRPLPR